MCMISVGAHIFRPRPPFYYVLFLRTLARDNAVRQFAAADVIFGVAFVTAVAAVIKDARVELQKRAGEFLSVFICHSRYPVPIHTIHIDTISLIVI